MIWALLKYCIRQSTIARHVGRCCARGGARPQVGRWRERSASERLRAGDESPDCRGRPEKLPLLVQSVQGCGGSRTAGHRGEVCCSPERTLEDTEHNELMAVAKVEENLLLGVFEVVCQCCVALRSSRVSARQQRCLRRPHPNLSSLTAKVGDVYARRDFLYMSLYP